MYKIDILRIFPHILRNWLYRILCSSDDASQRELPVAGVAARQVWRPGRLAVRLHLNQFMCSGHVTKCVRNRSAVTDLSRKNMSLFLAVFSLCFVLFCFFNCCYYLVTWPICFSVTLARGNLVNYL